ncbi:MAG: hypothetical protein ABW003_02585, partial [Microvirga sp.]
HALLAAGRTLTEQTAHSRLCLAHRIAARNRASDPSLLRQKNLSYKEQPVMAAALHPQIERFEKCELG